MKLRVAFRDDVDALARFAFGAASDGQVRVPCAHLAGPTQEIWSGEPVTESGETVGALFRHGHGFSLVALAVDECECGGIEAASAEAYRRLLAAVRPSAHPYLLRIWNYLGAINAGEGDAERYRRFCVGRAAAVDAMFNAPPPAATAIGAPQADGKLHVIALCTRTPGLALENPRQTPAWQYPREYSPVPPGFSRGALVGEGDDVRLLASGTASIVGHVSQHPGDAAAQARESLANLEALLAEARARSGRAFALERCEALRVYLRAPQDLPVVRAVLAERVTPERIAFLQGDICRRDLLVELEGVFAPRS